MQIAAPTTDTAVIIPIHPTKTPEQIADLKRGWLLDPCWDIEGTDGFEAHHEELKVFADAQRRIWGIEEQEREREERVAKLVRAANLGCSLTLLAYIERLECRIQRFEDEAQAEEERLEWEAEKKHRRQQVFG